MKFLSKIRHFLICTGVLLALIQCQDLPPAEKVTGTVDVTGANSQPANWQGCQTIYWGSTFSTTQNPFTPEITQTFTDIFSEFNNVGSSLRFEKASGANVATVTITYVPASSFKTTPTETEGVLHYSIPTKGISFYQIDANKKAIIYINADFKLTNAQLKTVLLHQIGKIIGLPANSSEPNSVMYPPDLNNAVKTLNVGDVAALKAKYGEDCPILLSANDNLSSIYDGSCGDILYFTNLNNTIYPDAQLAQAVQKAVTVWNNAGTYVKFTNTTDVSKAGVQIKFAPKSDFATNTFSNGGNSYTLTAISKIVKGSTANAAVIYLNQDFRWTDASLFRAITQQLGYYLGLTKSADAASMMYQLYQSMTPLIDLGQSDKTELAKRFGELCPLPIKIDKTGLKLENTPKYFGRCNVSYDVVIPTTLNIPTWANTALTDVFTAYNNANVNLKFATKAANEKQANLTITFTNAATVGKDNVAKIQYNDLVGLDSYTILINWEIITWTQQRIQSVMMHIMGNLLGLSQSPTNTTSIMYTTLKSVSPNLTISTTEATTLRNLYNGFCNYNAPLYFTKINTQSVPNCIIRCSWGYNGSFVTSNLTANTDKINQYLNYPRLATYSTVTNNSGIFFIYYLKKYNTYLTQLSDNYTFNVNKIPYNRLSYFTKATDGYNYTVYVNTEIPQLAQNNGAANNNLQMYYIGRMLGLEDSDDPTSIMYPYVSTTLKSPNATDIQQIQKISAPNCSYTLSSDWKKLSNNVANVGGFNFSINGKGYNGYANYWYEFNPATNQNIYKGTNTQSVFISGTSFCNSSTKGYTFGGYKNVTYANGDTTYNFSKELWEFDPVANKWTQLPDLPAQARQGAILFHINGKIYVGGGYFSTFIGNGRQTTTALSDFWEYDIATKKWTQKGNSGIPTNSCCGYSQWQSFTYQDKGYVLFTGKYVWSYDPTTDRWTTKTSHIGSNIYGGFFVIDNYAYTALPNALNEMYRYDVLNDRWTKTTDPGIWGPLAVSNYFSLNGKGYLIGYPIGFGSQPSQVWEYQP